MGAECCAGGHSHGGQGVVPSVVATNDNDQSTPLIELYLYIHSQQQRLQPQEYVSEELSSRVQVINGEMLLNMLLTSDFTKLTTKQPLLKEYIDATEEDFIGVINTLIKSSYIKRIIPQTINKKKYSTNATIRCNFAPKNDQLYDNDGLYSFLLQPAASPYALIKSLLIVGGIFAVCCFKIWPIILRIILWWLLLFTTVFLITSIIIHLLSKILFTLMCMRGYSFMPNLLDEEIGFFETFVPILGQGGEHQRRWALEREMQLRARSKLGLDSKGTRGKKDDAVAITPSESDSSSNDDTPTKDKTTIDPSTGEMGKNNKDKQVNEGVKNEKEKVQNALPAVNIFHTWQAGLFTFIILFIAGAIGCYNMGFFDPEMVPDFLVNNNEMRYYFPAIAATTSNTDEDSSNQNGYKHEQDSVVYTDKGEEISM